MLTYLKVKIRSLGAEAKIIRECERTALSRARMFKGITSKKHQLDTPKPELSAKAKRFAAYINSLEEADSEYNRFWGLHRHRIHVVRRETRDSLLAYGFLRGIPYEEIENQKYTHPDWINVERIAIRFNDGEIPEQVLLQQFAEWLENAKKMKLIGAE